MIKKIFLKVVRHISIFIYFLWPAQVFAQAKGCGPNEKKSDFGCIPVDPVGFVQKIYGIGLGLISFVALLFIIIGGYYILTSQGNSEQVSKGKSFIYYSIAGVLLAVFGFIFVEVISGDVLRIPGFQ